MMEIQLRQLATLRTIDLAITSGADLNLTLSMILDYVKKHLSVDAASVLLFNPQTQCLDFAAGTGFWTSALRHTHLQIGEGLAGQAAQERTIIHIPDLKKCKTEFAALRNFQRGKFRRILCRPPDRQGAGTGCA